MDLSGTSCGAPCEKLTPIGKSFHLLYLAGKGDRAQQWIDSGATTENRKSAASAARRMLRNVAFCNAVDFHRDQISKEVHFGKADLLQIYVDDVKPPENRGDELPSEKMARLRAGELIGKMQGYNAPTSLLLLRGIRDARQADNSVLIDVAKEMAGEDGRIVLAELLEEVDRKLAEGGG